MSLTFLPGGEAASSVNPAAAPVQPAPSAAPRLTNSLRSIQKATYVPLLANPSQLTPDQAPPGQAILKSGYIRQLNLQQGEVDAVQKSLSVLDALPSQTPAPDANLWSLLRRFEGALLPAQLPAPSTLANIDQNSLLLFGNALVNIRQQAVQRLQQPSGAPAGAQPSVAAPAQALGTALNLLNIAMGSTSAFQANAAVTPLGMLNLERLEMTPAGIERGELLATIPLAPKERTSVVQKEWSVTSQEFTTIVTDSLENYSETGVTENTQLSQATTSQVAHGNQFNITASAQGGCGFVSGSSSVTFGTQDQTSNSANDSRQHALQTTRKASSRATQSHKTTISTTTVTGTSEATTRMLENPSATDPIRIDYFSFMRKWYVALYRYDLRLTYDITIPEPGAALRKTFQQLAELQAQAAEGFTFTIPYSAITPGNYQLLAQQYGAQVPPPPAAAKPQTYAAQPTTGAGFNFYDLPITVPRDNEISDVTVTLNVQQLKDDVHARYAVLGSGWDKTDQPTGTYSQDLTQLSSYMLGYSDSQTISFLFQDVVGGSAHIFVVITTKITDTAMQQWVVSVWTALFNAAQTTFYTQQQAYNAQISALQDQINSVDTLTLRREENDEIMKCVLRWILGDSFEFMPTEVVKLFEASDLPLEPNPPIYNNLVYGVDFTGNDLGPSGLNWNIMKQHEDEVNFINQAIEWENVVYFLYSYFWDIPMSWDFIRKIQHPDKTRQAFLRSGSARVVLTVRKGWEVAWTYFTQTRRTTGSPGALADHPYMTIAQQIQAYAETNYPGIPPANPNGGA